MLAIHLQSLKGGSVFSQGFISLGGGNSSLETASLILWAISKLEKQQAPQLPVYLGHWELEIHKKEEKALSQSVI